MDMHLAGDGPRSLYLSVPEQQLETLPHAAAAAATYLLLHLPSYIVVVADAAANTTAATGSKGHQFAFAKRTCGNWDGFSFSPGLDATAAAAGIPKGDQI